MSLEDIINKIISERPELTKEEILKIIKKREKNAKGFLTPESAALSLAADLGITLDVSFKREVNVKDLVSGLNDVTISGRIINVSPLKKFSRQDGREGARRTIYIADKTGIVKAVLWDDKATFQNIEDLLDEIVRISHASVRRRAGGNLELNVGYKSKIEIRPENLKEEDYPPIVNFANKLSELYRGEDEVNIIGYIQQVYPLTTFKKQDGSEGKVKHIEITDNRGRITVVLWNNHADVLSEEHIGKYVMLIKLRAKERFNGQIELHTKDQTRILLLKKRPSGF
ncbi:MAG: OB-fold nucleic acid binding domain-containing protein [Candidatus Bathyarchaeia archaeon]